jgi:hypothetical protein
MKKFSKKERSTFKYWFAHWCAFQFLALNCRCWKFKYLFHDWEKPWLKLFLDYEDVQYFHRRNAKHHLEYKGGFDKIDWEALVIDWECSRFTKASCFLNAQDEMKKLMKTSVFYENTLPEKIIPILKKLDLFEED